MAGNVGDVRSNRHNRRGADGRWVKNQSPPPATDNGSYVRASPKATAALVRKRFGPLPVSGTDALARAAGISVRALGVHGQKVDELRQQMTGTDPLADARAACAAAPGEGATVDFAAAAAVAAVTAPLVR